MPSQNRLSTIHVEPSYPAVQAEPVVGLIVCSNDYITELEMRRMLKDERIALSATRIKHEEPSSPEMAIESLHRHIYEIAKAGEMFDPPDAISVFAYACTSGSAVISQQKLESELHQARPGASLTSPMAGALRAFDKLGVKRVAMLTPYIEEEGAVVADCIENSGFRVCASASFNRISEVGIAAVSPESIFEAACTMDSWEAEALFIPCTLLRTSSIIDRLEERTGKPVITAHQAMLWDSLRLAGYEKPVSGYGRLLKKPALR
ncbi:hypothetical protein [Mesorhizobium sp. WSM3862]|uniref:maleate cis-trans isomerase family protein n=1 Tax=Mesorhizobium sp. WSM3862 TaxID=632858 RepID=UPI000BB08FDA|nr:hypothetical protein [Mesorhizobium sp. WSM3862]PBB98895.1 hypothetical protein CK224_04530 [Mesorhizobium sp. WSM3862]